MLLQAAVVIEFAAMLGDIQTVQQLVAATWAFQWITQGDALIVVVFMNQLEQFENPAWRDLGALIFIKPDALTGKTQIEHNFAVQQAFKTMFAHHLAARRAGCRFHLKRDVVKKVKTKL